MTRGKEEAPRTGDDQTSGQVDPATSTNFLPPAVEAAPAATTTPARGPGEAGAIPRTSDDRSRDVAVLYVDPRGPYPLLVEHWYDEARDAKSYAGALPVVAHPPCGPWGPLRHLNEKQDPACGPHAVEVVRRLGGVLEHPKGSTLFRHCGMPHPGELPDAWGGQTYAVNQCDWGHVARKPTWIYVVGTRTFPPVPPPREPTHWCSGFRSSTHRNPKHYKQNGSAVPPGIKVASAQQRRRTPVAFALWLIEIARNARQELRHAG